MTSHMDLGLLTRRALAVALALPALAASAAPTAAAPSKRFFAPSSPWNRPLGQAPALDRASAARVAALRAEVTAELASGRGPYLDALDYSSPVYVVGARRRHVPVVLDGVGAGNPLRRILARGVPLPDRAQPASGTDGALILDQPATDTLWEFWRLRRVDGAWHARWGGVLRHASASSGFYSDRAYPGLDSWQGWTWGVTASSASVAGGLITLRDLRRGRIDHAVAMTVPRPCAKVFAFPAQRTDGTSTDPRCLPEGARLRLDPRVDVGRLGLPPVVRMIARAAQRYGMIVTDRTGWMVGFRAQSPRPLGTDPYTGARGYFAGVRPNRLFEDFPWARLQVLRMSTCTAFPCAG